MDPIAHESSPLSPIKSPPASLFGSSLHSSHTSFPIIAIAIIGILATAFLLVSYYIFVIKCCLNWHRIDLLRRFSFSRARPAEDPLSVYAPVLVENRGLNEAAIRSIPLFKFRKPSADNGGIGVGVGGATCECAVCLNEFQEEEKLRIIPNCGHVFHIDCIDVWLQNNANCPLCRTSISANRHDVVIHFVADPNLDLSPSPQDPTPGHGDDNNDNDDNYVVIEIRSERETFVSPSLPRIPERSSPNELLTIGAKVSETKTSRKKAKKLSHSVSSKGDECIDNRKKDERFSVQPMRRSFSMDSAADTQLYLAVQEIMLQQRQVNSETGAVEGSSNRLKRSFFSFGQGRGSRSAVQSLALDS